MQESRKHQCVLGALFLYQSFERLPFNNFLEPCFYILISNLNKPTTNPDIVWHESKISTTSKEVNKLYITFSFFKKSLRNKHHLNSISPFFLCFSQQLNRAYGRFPPPTFKMTRYEYVTREIGVPTCVLTAADCETAKELPQWVPLTGRRAEFQVGWAAFGCTFLGVLVLCYFLLWGE